VVVFGQMMVALVFAELSVVYPLAGALYQWARRLVGYRYGWFVGWIYGWALLVTIASIDLGAAPYILDVLGVQPEPWITVLLAVGLCLLHSVINLCGVKITAIITNLGLIVEVGMTVVLGGKNIILLSW
jgi:amino acid transporter